MMDFLRSLAPPRGSDGTRAVPVLSPRFANAANALEGAGDAQPFDDVSEPGTSANPATVALPDARVPGSRHDRHGDAGTFVHAPQVVAHMPPPNSDRGVGEVLPPFDAGPPTNDRTNRFDTEPARPTTMRAATPPFQTSRQARPSSPLSDAALAQRFMPARETDEVVHVTIGRIDVVANTSAPAPTPRREPVRRPETVSLADYLRGGNDGGRR